MDKLPKEILTIIYNYKPLICFSCQNYIKYNELNNTLIKGSYCYCSKQCFYNFFLFC